MFNGRKFNNSIEGEITLLSIGMFLSLTVLISSSILLNAFSTNRENFLEGETKNPKKPWVSRFQKHNSR